MKKILILLSLIYFISCGTEYCNSITQADKSEDCLTAEVQDANNNCCYLQIGQSTTEGSQTIGKLCYEFSKQATLDQLKEQLTKQYQGDNQILENIICPSDQGQGGSTTNGSYLKTGILLLVAFFL